MSYYPYITVGGKYGSSIVIKGNIQALPVPVQGLIRRYFNRWRTLHDPTSFPHLIEDLRGFTPPLKIDSIAHDRFNKYIEIHTVVLSTQDGAGASHKLGNEARDRAFVDARTKGARLITVRKKCDRTTPRIAAVLRAFFDETGAMREAWRVWEFSERMREADGFIEYDLAFVEAFAGIARKTVAFLPSSFFKYQIEVAFHPKILREEYSITLNPHVENWPFTERNGKPAARWLVRSPLVLGRIAKELADTGCNVKLYSGAWENAMRAYLLAGEASSTPPVEPVATVRIADFDERSHGAGQVQSVSAKAVLTSIGDDDLAGALTAKLYPFQRTGVRHLAHTGRAMLADDMGLGKTAQAIAALRVLAARAKLHRALIICPASLKYQWKDEIERFTNLEPIVVDGDRESRIALYETLARNRYLLETAAREKLPEVIIANYELTFRDEKKLIDLKPDAIVLDEAQRIKNWQSKTHQAIVDMPARFRFVLSGTPLENEFMELFNVLRFVDPDVLGVNPVDVRRRYTVYDKFGGIAGYQNLREASRRISGVSLRRTRENVLTELPDLTENYFWLELDLEQRKIYRDLDDRARGFLSADEWTRVAYDNALTTVQRLREVCDTPEMLFPEHKASAKLNELKTILGEQVGQLGRRAIVFTQWTRMAEILARELTAWGLSYRYMHGAVKSRDRTRIVNEFNAGDAQVFLSTDAGSTGINLQAASIVVNFDLPFNPAVVDQRVARAHRHGQKSSVNAIHLVMRGTIEEHLVKILNRRRELFKDIMSEVGDAISPMTPSASSRVFLIELLGQRVPSL